MKICLSKLVVYEDSTSSTELEYINLNPKPLLALLLIFSCVVRLFFVLQEHATSYFCSILFVRTIFFYLLINFLYLILDKLCSGHATFPLQHGNLGQSVLPSEYQSHTSKSTNVRREHWSSNNSNFTSSQKQSRSF